MTKEIRIECPRCKNFVARVKSVEAELEVNCNRCRKPVIVKLANDRMSVELAPAQG